MRYDDDEIAGAIMKIMNKPHVFEDLRRIITAAEEIAIDANEAAACFSKRATTSESVTEYR